MSAVRQESTDIPHPCDVLHQFFVVSLDAQSRLVGHGFGLIHLSLCLQQRVDAYFFVFLEYLIAELMFLLLAGSSLAIGRFPFVRSQLVLIEADLNGEGRTLVRMSGCWQMPHSISIRLIWTRCGEYFLRGFGKGLVYLGQLAAVLGLLQLLLHLADVLEEVSLASIENVRHLICMADRQE